MEEGVVDVVHGGIVGHGAEEDGCEDYVVGRWCVGVLGVGGREDGECFLGDCCHLGAGVRAGFGACKVGYCP